MFKIPIITLGFTIFLLHQYYPSNEALVGVIWGGQDVNFARRNKNK